MKKLITIFLLISFISCNDKTTSTQDVKQDTAKPTIVSDTVVAIDTVARRMASRAQASVAEIIDSAKSIIDSTWVVNQDNYLTDLELNRRIDRKLRVDLQTARKEIRLDLKDSMDRYRKILEDSFSKIHPVIFPDDSSIVGQEIDTVFRKRL